MTTKSSEVTQPGDEGKAPERIWLHRTPTLAGKTVTPDGYFRRGSVDLECATEYIRADIARSVAPVPDAPWKTEDGIEIVPCTVNVCRPCINLEGQECHTPECAFCFRGVDEVKHYLDVILVCPVIKNDDGSEERINLAPTATLSAPVPDAAKAAAEINRRIAAIAPEDRESRIAEIISQHCSTPSVGDAIKVVEKLDRHGLDTSDCKFSDDCWAGIEKADDGNYLLRSDVLTALQSLSVAQPSGESHYTCYELITHGTVACVVQDDTKRENLLHEIRELGGSAIVGEISKTDFDRYGDDDWTEPISTTRWMAVVGESLELRPVAQPDKEKND